MKTVPSPFGGVACVGPIFTRMLQRCQYQLDESMVSRWAEEVGGEMARLTILFRYISIDLFSDLIDRPSRSENGSFAFLCVHVVVSFF